MAPPPQASPSRRVSTPDDIKTEPANVVMGTWPDGGGGSGGSGDGGFGPRIDQLEIHATYIKDGIKEIKGDLRTLLRAGLVAVLVLLGAFAGGYVRLDNRISALQSNVVDLKIEATRISERTRQILDQLDQSGDREVETVGDR